MEFYSSLICLQHLKFKIQTDLESLEITLISRLESFYNSKDYVSKIYK